jgi:hypothetical protein
MLSLHEINISTDTLTMHDKKIHESASEVIPGKRAYADVEHLADTSRIYVLNLR